MIYGALVVLSLVAYLPKLAQLLSAFYRPPHRKAKGKRVISLVIPAREESAVIGDLFVSIGTQTYDRQFFDVNVIVNSPDDPTVAMAQKIGANVFVVPDQKCKGDALDGFFKQLDKEKFARSAAFVIVDADAVLSPDYVEELNNALEYDVDIYLSRKYVKNYLGDKKNRSLYCNCSVLTYPQLDDLSNNYRTRHKIPMNMCGQGMMIRRGVIEQTGGWPYRTLTEDYELRMDCFLRGFTSMYYPYAKIYTEEVLTHKQSYIRRIRWLTGYNQCDRKYKKRIRAQVKARGSFTEGEFEYFYSLYPAVLYIVTTIVTTFVGVGLTIFYAIHKMKAWLYALTLLVVLPLGVMYLIVFLYCVLCMLAYRDVFAPIRWWEKLATLLFAPVFCLEYFPIYFRSRMLSRTQMEWQPTEHIVYAENDGDNP